MITAADNDCPAVVINLANVQAVWRRLTRILIREGAAPWVSIFFFKDVFQSVLLSGAEIWVVTPCMGQVMGGLQYQVAQRFTGRIPRRCHDVKWE